MTLLQASILVVSDTASSDPSADKAIPILADVFKAEGGGQWATPDTAIVPDDVVAIQRQICRWSDTVDLVNLIITTGGTGFAVKDNTPEAVEPLIDRHGPGLVHGMLAASLEVTPFAMMSRPVAGVRKRTLILTLPGSPKGAKENLLAVLKLLPHACQQAAGGDTRLMHVGGVKQLEQDVGFKQNSFQNHHDHHHGHHHAHHGHKIPIPHTKPNDKLLSNDPKAGPSARNRESPYPIISVDAALKAVSDAISGPLDIVQRPVDGSLLGHYLAKDVQAAEPVPAFRASIVDGYAIVTSGSSKGVFSVASVSHASSNQIPELRPGQVARITTGAPLPLNANAVVMVEDTVIRSRNDDGKDEKEVEILTDDIVADENVRDIGSDIEQGQIVLKAGEEITSAGGELGTLASIGISQVSVTRKPIVGVLSTGDEIVQHDREEKLRLGEVRDCNRPSIMAVLKAWGYEVVDLGIATDKQQSLEEHLRTGIRKCDILITSGGVSMGELDLLKPTIERSLGGTIHFGRVAMKPGKPTTFATIPYKPTTGDRNAARDQLLFSLPGNPASALVTTSLFVLPALQQLSGKPKPWGLPRMKVVLGEQIRCDKSRPEYHRVKLQAGDDGRIYAYSTGGQRSSRVGSLNGAKGLLCLPAQEGVIDKGTLVDALLMGGLAGIGDVDA